MTYVEGFDHLRIPLEEIKSATNFDDQSCIGRGGFGKVYRGHLILPQGRKTVAIKRCDKAGYQGELEFFKEIQLLSGFRHHNLISLIGFCDEDQEMVLVYEFAAGGSLDRHLFGTKPLTWEGRLNICIGAARGLDYLHSDVEPRVIHRDVKSANILLDENFEAKIADLGLSRTGPADQPFSINMQSRVAGTPGYVDPEYYSTGHLTIESDTYSFGVVLFEVLCGRRAVDERYNDNQGVLSRMARRRFQEQRIEEIVDPSLAKQIKPNSLSTFSTIACQCLRERPEERPTMNIVVQELEKALGYQVSNSIGTMRQIEDNSQMSQLKHLRIPFEAIKSATSNFNTRNFMITDSFGSNYSGKLSHLGKTMDVMVKRWCKSSSQGRQEFFREITMLHTYRHRNIVSLVGFCDEDGELIIVYKYPTHGFFSDYIDKNDHLPWAERLKICIGIARGMRYLHTGVGREHFIMHTDIKTFNILLDANWEPKITNFGLSTVCSSNLQFLMANPHGTISYCDPEFSKAGVLSKSSDVYSFGVVLFEVLCGRFAVDTKFSYESKYLMNLVDKCCVGERAIETIIDCNFDTRQIDSDSLKTFVEIAYQCSNESAEERPTFSKIVVELEKALTFQKRRTVNSQACGSSTAVREIREKSHMKQLEHLRIPPGEIQLATNDLASGNFHGEDGYGFNMYKGKRLRYGRTSEVLVSRWKESSDMRKNDFLIGIARLSTCKHKNIISLIGFCEEETDLNIVYKYPTRGRLSEYVKKGTFLKPLKWAERLKICIGVARGLQYLHTSLGSQHFMIHADISSGNIWLDHRLEPKISCFRFSKLCPASLQFLTCDDARYSSGNLDPEFPETGMLSKSSDVYSLGVVLFDVLCGRQVEEEDNKLMDFIHKCSIGERTIETIVDCDLRMEQIDTKSLSSFSAIAYQCVKERGEEQPTLSQLIQELEKALEFHEWKEQQSQVFFPSKKVEETTGQSLMAEIERLQDLRIPLKDIMLATNNFGPEHFRGKDGYGFYTYEGQRSHNGTTTNILVVRWEESSDIGRIGFMTEIKALSSCENKNIISLIGFCDEDSELIIVYKYPTNGRLSAYVNKEAGHNTLTWVERLKICIGIACGVRYLHTLVLGEHFIVHSDIKSVCVFLDDHLEPKISGFGLSSFCSTSIRMSRVEPRGTIGYCDPEFLQTGRLWESADIYSLGVVFFEVLTGRNVNYIDDMEEKLMDLVHEFSIGERAIGKVVDCDLNMEHIKSNSLRIFSEIACQCVKMRGKDRPTISLIVAELKKALASQESKEQKSQVFFPEQPLMTELDHLQHLRIPLNGIKLATNNFDQENFRGKDRYGYFTYEGQRSQNGRTTNMLVVRWGELSDIGRNRFITEIQALSTCEHKNIISFIGFCDEDSEMIIVYKYPTDGRLSTYVNKEAGHNPLTWVERLSICISIACGLQYLHTLVLGENFIIHSDIKSLSVLFDDNLEPKICSFCLSRIC